MPVLIDSCLIESIKWCIIIPRAACYSGDIKFSVQEERNEQNSKQQPRKRKKLTLTFYNHSASEEGNTGKCKKCHEMQDSLGEEGEGENKNESFAG